MASGNRSGVANTWLAGNLTVYIFINDPNGLFTADELARIQDAINAWDAVLAPYNVTITEVSDPTWPTSSSTPAPPAPAAASPTACWAATMRPTARSRWSKAGTGTPAPTRAQIGAGQYDFETAVLHELGHALGLGGSTDPSSPMYETLAAGAADRTVATQDLNIPDPPEGADPQTAAGFHFVSDAPALSPNGTLACDRLGTEPQRGRSDASFTCRGHRDILFDRPHAAVQPAPAAYRVDGPAIAVSPRLLRIRLPHPRQRIGKPSAVSFPGSHRSRQTSSRDQSSRGSRPELPCRPESRTNRIRSTPPSNRKQIGRTSPFPFRRVSGPAWRPIRPCRSWPAT